MKDEAHQTPDQPTTEDMEEQYVAGGMVTGFACIRDEARTDFYQWLREVKAQAWDEGHDAGYHACHWEHLTGGPCADDPNDSEAINPYR